MNSRKDSTRVAVELIFRLVVADAVDNATSNVHKVDVGFRFNLASHYHLTSGNERLYSHLRVGVVGKKFVEKCVRDLVSHLVGVPFRDRFRCE